jgi:hypothetical protein
MSNLPDPPTEPALGSKQYGLGGTNYATARSAKEQADNAKAWEAANVPPATRVLNVRRGTVKARIVKRQPKGLTK